ncbi:Maltodextrin import ATP-binding protein msmX [Vibrio nigripulchritudo MADA3029]|uniref:ABC transporter ATP-binding protein n=1 Tax=Vibrio nigripulchritudo TaxID=28173 RepID=UPI0003B1974E|nr:ABC transporter ATP-binding protein [Vibrio nigripulchritudo]CCN46430.1 Maltodextrin import ATP-binding protein msmX [Vibrio nigripulchritudo MADA3020]CCN53500.1 Maltodextrin import ATP-binding protein msmX [Vibrio nigripulchritudo MADA3021]CCN58452.1 Maltodextrin import ATP-binding protein msmX [Vibrio nigripulchritudo MADA3029]
MASVELKHLSKSWSSVVSVDQLNLSIEDREFLVLLGPSGCGKSTTMRMIAGLETPSEGDIIIDGKRVNDLPPNERDLAMVFQSYALYPHKTVRNNIDFPLKVQGLDKSKRQVLIQQVAERVELEHLLERKPAQLSGGQRQRVALARAIVRQPKLFLLDEPLSNLDAKLRSSMRAELKKLQEELAVTTIYVTHDQVEAMTLADRIVVINQGRIQQVGTPEAIYDKPKNTFVATFLGNPPMNLIHLDETMHLHAPQDAVTLGVRPENIQLVPTENAMLNASVSLVELLGDSYLYTLKTDNQTLLVKTTRDMHAKTGDTIGLQFSPEHTHWFDADGERIEPQSERLQ